MTWGIFDGTTEVWLDKILVTSMIYSSRLFVGSSRFVVAPIICCGNHQDNSEHSMQIHIYEGSSLKWLPIYRWVWPFETRGILDQITNIVQITKILCHIKRTRTAMHVSNESQIFMADWNWISDMRHAFQETINGHIGVLIAAGNDGLIFTDGEFNTQWLKIVLNYFLIKRPPVGRSFRV